MSLFLGKIHYWLFNKILWFEGLEEQIIGLAEEEGLDTDKIKKEIDEKHGEKLPNKNLEELIDQSNIHGWLQAKIHSAEGRMAAWTYIILKSGADSFAKMEKVYKEQGMKAAEEVLENGRLENACDIYNAVNDYILDGMPCDRVNEIIVNEDDLVQWKRRICVHKEIWEREGVDVEIFYKLRSLWIKAFVNEVNENFEYTEDEDGIMSIKKR